MINVTKTFLRPIEDYVNHLQRIWVSAWITHNGELVQELVEKLAEYSGIPYIQYVSNGTLAMQSALQALDIQGDVIPTPSSDVATTHALLWEYCNPVFADIYQETFCLNPENIEPAITENTQATLAVHVFGHPCDIYTIKIIAQKHGLNDLVQGCIPATVQCRQ